MIFEDECYSDLIWDGKRPPSLYAMANGEGVILSARSPSRSRRRCASATSSPSGSPGAHPGAEAGRGLGRARADGAGGVLHAAFRRRMCPSSTRRCARKLQALREALAEQFGTAAEFGDPPGGIYLWIKLPDNVDTHEARAGGAGGRRVAQSRPGMVDQQGATPQPAAAVLRQSRARRPSARASRCWPRSAAANSACRRGFPM